MVIIDEPYASDVLIKWLEESKEPVLDNAFAKKISETHKLNLISDTEAIKRVNAGESVYTNSENALAWLLENTENENRNRSIELFKDKAAMRRKLASLSPGFFYRELTKSELADFDVTDIELPVVLKPAVGFCSMGVYVIENASDWDAALEDIAKSEAIWNERYPQSVVDGENYLLEGYLDGQEYAIDMYYDRDGKANILNILRHDFASADDTSDRLYITNHDIVDDTYDKFMDWLDSVNKVIGARDFPVHVEIRMKDDDIIPIEFNPLRFAGLGGTDISYHGLGFRTYEAYLKETPIDLKKLYAKHPDDTYSMSLLNPSVNADLSRPFDHDSLASRFSNVIGFCKFDANVTGSFGFLFLKTDRSNADELDFILHSDLLEFQM
ncbi:MAG: ATP-grasp domain-containing protein [Eggerthellaceae bacterium]|nr:ATP-grasp domain-containing protein [Eggerthellaceae bacterium]